jgi:hypothetical protein
MECGHKFNYKPLYKDIKQQKFTFLTYTYDSLSSSMKKKFTETGLDYYIKCPYCRDIQFTLLPFNEEIEEKYKIKEIYGINSIKASLKPQNSTISRPKPSSYIVTKFGVEFKSLGQQCCKTPLCPYIYTCLLPELNKHYCMKHWNGAKKAYAKTQQEEKKKQQKEQKEKEKQEKQAQKEKEFEDKNNERIAKGLKPLVPKKKKNIINEVVGELTINEYVPEINNSLLCKGIVKSGINKGKQCTFKHLENDNYCCKHSETYKQQCKDAIVKLNNQLK